MRTINTASFPNRHISRMKTKPPQFSPPLLAYERKHVKIVKFLCCAPTLWYPVPLHYRGCHMLYQHAKKEFMFEFYIKFGLYYMQKAWSAWINCMVLQSPQDSGFRSLCKNHGIPYLMHKEGHIRIIRKFGAQWIYRFRLDFRTPSGKYGIPYPHVKMKVIFELYVKF